MTMKLNAELIRAVRHLYGLGKITSDKDIADKTGYGKATVSSYVNGNIRASEKFINKFENSFELSLKDFKEEPQKSQTVESLADENVAVKYVKLLEQQNETLRKRVEIDLIEIRKDVAVMQAVLSELYTHCVKDEEKDKSLYETLQKISKEYSRLNDQDI